MDIYEEFNTNSSFYDYLINKNFFKKKELENYYYLNELQEIKYEWFIINNTPIFITNMKKTNITNDNILYYLKSNVAININYNGDYNNYYKLKEHEKMIDKYYIAMSDLYNYKLYKELILKNSLQDNIINKLNSKIQNYNNLIYLIFGFMLYGVLYK